MTTMSCRILRPPDPAGCSPPPPEGNTPAGEAKEAGRREGRGEVVRGRRDAEGKQEEKDMGALTPTRSHVQVYILLPSLNALDLASAGYTLAHPSHGHLNHRNGHSCDVFLWSASDPRHQVRRRGNRSAGAPKGEVKPPRLTNATRAGAEARCPWDDGEDRSGDRATPRAGERRTAALHLIKKYRP